MIRVEMTEEYVFDCLLMEDEEEKVKKYMEEHEQSYITMTEAVRILWRQGDIDITACRELRGRDCSDIRWAQEYELKEEI